MNHVWVNAAELGEAGIVKFTQKGEAAITAMFRVLDADNSDGLNFQEMKAYFLLTEGIDFQTCNAWMLYI